MQLSNAPGKLVLPFANAGAKNTIPAASQIGITAGAASLTDGFPPLTRTPIAAGGVPPSGLDMNGILYALSAALRWANAGGGYVYDGTFAADSNVGGYPKGARVLRSDGAGYWLNTIDGNTVDPESVTVNQAQIAGWVPDLTNGVAAVTMTSANVTLTPLQYGKPIIVLSGTLTANLNLIFPNLAGEWTVVNNCTGAFTVTAKTAAGTGAVVTPGRTRIIWGNGTNIAGAMNEVETPAQFDATTKIATMAAVQRALGNYAGQVSVSTSRSLLASESGLIVNAGGTITVTLPVSSGVPLAGASYQINNDGSGIVTVQAGAGDNLYGIGNGTPRTFVLGAGDSITVGYVGGTSWYAWGGLQLGASAMFGASKSNNGYQKLPGGLIIQWGQVSTAASIPGASISFPIAFPTAPLFTFAASAEGNNTANSGNVTTTGMQITTYQGTNQAAIALSNVPWLAIGY